MRLQNKIVLVTGAASGIGYAVTELFAKEGATVIATDIGEPAKAYPAGVETLPLDVTKEGDWEAGVAAIVARHGRLDVLVNNAGIIAYEPLHELSLEAWNRMVAVDQTGVFLGMREAVRAMRGKNPGAIVNISSIWGAAGVAGAHSYQAAKSAVRNMTKNAAITYATDGIRANAVLPGFIHTPLTDAQAADLNEATIGATPMKRGGTAQEIANGALFLASDEASFVTGAELVIDGGYLAQ